MRAGVSGRSATSRPPRHPRVDSAGVIDEVGEDSRWQVGDLVMAIALPFGEHRGAYAEYLVGPDDSMARSPAGMDLPHAATLPMNGLTAMQILERLDLRPGQVLAVTGAPLAPWQLPGPAGQARRPDRRRRRGGA